ncbi:MAG: hypothetical protein MUD01_22755 [Chloroflexaceae bacterium]|nr:hypothetical protein [Chloroflexaceae bacterium]
MTNLLFQFNELLASSVLIVAFSLLAYILLQNWRNGIARSLCVLLFSVVIVNAGDVLISRAIRPTTLQILLRAQWLGIALVPAAYLHLANGLLVASQGAAAEASRRWHVWAGYACSALLMVLALLTDLVVMGGIPSGPLAQFGAGPLFWLYLAFFVASILVMFRATVVARQNSLTPTTRRRMTYLGITFAAPGLGVFPYLVIAGAHTSLPSGALLLLSAAVNIGVMVMITVMTYSVAFQGVLLPDRLIKQDFVRWGLYGPFVGLTIILFLQVVPGLARQFGLPETTLLTFGVMVMTVLMPILVRRVKPYLDKLIYMQDQDEIDYLRNLPRSTFTTTDLRQLLENSLIAVCGALKVETGFVVGPSEPGDDGELSYSVKAVCGSRREVRRFVQEHPLNELMLQLERVRVNHPGMLPPADAFLACNGFCMLPLHSPDGAFLGALGVGFPPEVLRSNGGLSSDARRLISVLAHQMELGLTTVQMQQRLFNMLRGLGPEMQSLQELSTRLEQATPATLATLDTDVALQPEFFKLVKDALNDYWGGPKLSDSPLLGLRVVRRVLRDEGSSPTRALQAVLRKAIDNMRPDDQLDPSAQEWLLYNILELRFLQGKQARDVANRLAMSESDFYRKQRIAIEEVARQLGRR